MTLDFVDDFRQVSILQLLGNICYKSEYNADGKSA